MPPSVRSPRRSSPDPTSIWVSLGLFLLSFVALALFSSSSAAVGPKNIAFQGYLTDEAGVPVSTDSLGVTVATSMWNAEVGGSLLWSETYTNIVITEGVFNVELGATEGLNATNFDGTPIFLEIAIDGEPPLPRTEMHGSPFAVRSYHADRADDLAGGVAVRSLNGLTEAVTLEGGANVDITQEGNTLTFDAVGGGGADDDWVVDGDNVYHFEGNVGVGTEDPRRKLHLQTNALSLGESDFSPNVDLIVESTDATIGMFSSTGGADGSKISMSEVSGGEVVDTWSMLRKTSSGGRGLAFQFTDAGEVMRLGPDGNVGVGTTDPIRKLHLKTGSLGLVREDLSVNYDLVVESTDAVLGLFSDAGGNDGSTLVLGEVSGGEINAWSLRRKTTGGGGDLLITNSDAGEVMRLSNEGQIGVGTSFPSTKLDVRGTGSFQEALYLHQPIITNFATLRMSNLNGGVNFLYGGALTVQLDFFGNVTDAMVITSNGTAINGTTTTDVLEITGGADLAEPFRVGGDNEIEPGMVLTIDPVRAGELRIARRAYDRTVAGIASGANGVKAGITLSQEGTAADGSVPVALSGRVYCLVDASHGPVKPGDLLTTSDTPGHAMKVRDHDRATGAIIGKAMSTLERGRGHVLVLVSLQ